MNQSNPFEPQDSSAGQPPGNSGLRIAGRVVLGLGLVVLGYGAVAFWLLSSLPPNTPGSRLPSLVVMGVGIAITLVGLAVSGMSAPKNSESKKGGIPSWLGIIILLAILGGFFAVVAQM